VTFNIRVLLSHGFLPILKKTLPLPYFIYVYKNLFLSYIQSCSVLKPYLLSQYVEPLAFTLVWRVRPQWPVRNSCLSSTR
jgi:hypothetical protein